jgi:hypothetical protein
MFRFLGVLTNSYLGNIVNVGKMLGKYVKEKPQGYELSLGF